MYRKLKQYSALALSLFAGSIAISCTRPAGGEPAAGNAANTGRSGGRAGGRGPASDRPTPVEVELVKRGSVSRSSVIAGMLEPIRTVGVNAQLSGILLSLKAEEGHRVRQGDVLAEIVQNRLGNANLPVIFPSYTPTFRGVTL